MKFKEFKRRFEGVLLETVVSLGVISFGGLVIFLLTNIIMELAIKTTDNKIAIYILTVGIPISTFYYLLLNLSSVTRFILNRKEVD